MLDAVSIDSPVGFVGCFDSRDRPGGAAGLLDEGLEEKGLLDEAGWLELEG